MRSTKHLNVDLSTNEETNKLVDLLKAKHGLTDRDTDSSTLWPKSSSCLLTRDNIHLARSCLSKLDEITKVNMLLSILRLPKCLANEWCTELTLLTKDCLSSEPSIFGWLPYIARIIVIYLGQVSRKCEQQNLTSSIVGSFTKLEQQIMTLNNAFEPALRLCSPEILPLEYLYSSELSRTEWSAFSA